MRNVAAKFDDDFGYEEPVRTARPRRTRSANPRKRAGAKPKRDKSRYLRYAAIGLSAALTVGIMVNALVLQQSKHPAPLFTKAITLAEDAPPVLVPAQPPVQAQTPTPTPRSSSPAPAKSVDQSGSSSDLLASPHPVPQQKLATPVQRPRHVASEPTKARSEDAIGSLLKTSTAAPADKTRDHVVKGPPKADAKTVLATQHALMKLGFVIKPNGTFGPVTHAAIESFERDQHMPVKGEMSPKVLKQLSAESGVAID